MTLSTGNLLALPTARCAKPKANLSGSSNMWRYPAIHGSARHVKPIFSGHIAFQTRADAPTSTLS